MNKKLNKVIGILEERYNNLFSYSTSERILKFFNSNIDGNPEKLEFDDSNWENVTIPFEWDTKNDVWFRKKIVVPNDINGISIKGSKLEVCGNGYMSGTAIVIGHGEMYIDGRKIFEELNWTDFRYRNLVSSNALPGETHIIAYHFFKRQDYIDYYPRKLNLMEIHYSNIDNIVFELGSFIEEVKFAQSLTGGIYVLEEAFGNLDIEDLKNIDIYELIKLLNLLRGKLSSLKSLAKKYKVYLIGHAHIDMNWLWPMDETINICKNTFSTIEKLMKNFPNFCFSQSQAYTYRLIEENYPDLFKSMEKRIKEKRWDITASSWVESDLNMASGESIVRQILYAKKYIKEKFNFEPRVFWSPDTFGHPWTIPQILKKSGIDYYFFMRQSKRNYDLFWWEGPDGSKVLTFNSKYMAQPSAKDFIELVKFTSKSQNMDISMYVYGTGDHGGGPTAEDIMTVNKLNKKSLMPSLEFSTTHSYFDAVSDKKDTYIPTVCDEFNPIFDGCYTTHWDTKLHNRNCERLAVEAESAGAICKILDLEYPDLKKVWEITLFNQFHDILPGSGIKPAHSYSNSQAEEAEKIAKDALNGCIEEISKKIDVKKENIPFIVFNSLSWNRSDVVSIKLTDDIPKNPVVKDEDGGIYPVQIMDDMMLFIGKDIPSLGYKVYYICEGKEEHNFKSVKFRKNLTAENEFFILGIDENTGTISFLYDKKNRRFVMKKRRDEGSESENTFPLKIKVEESSNMYPATGSVLNNMLQVLYEEPHCWSAWVIGTIGSVVNLIKDPKIEVISTGPVAGIIRVKNKFKRSNIIQDIVLYSGIERIDINTYIDWKERSDPNSPCPMLKASFTPILGITKATYNIPFGSIERIADGREFPALNWVDISDNKYGLGILTDTKYGFDVKGNTIRITLIRTSHDPDPNPDEGSHKFTYSIYPHTGDFKKSDIERKGYELNHRLIASYIKNNRNDADLPEKQSFISIDSPNVILSCFKKAESSNDLIIRVYESKGRKVKTNIEFGFSVKRIEEVNLLEESLNNSSILVNSNKFSFTINPYEIKTFKILTNKLDIYKG